MEQAFKESVTPFERPVYPFTAIVGRDKLKRALIINAIDPSIGGVLFTGPKGTGKSMTVRAAAAILPEVEGVEDCVFHCNLSDPTNVCETCRARLDEGAPIPKMKKRMKIVQIPIGATEDRVIGTLNIETTLKEGIKALQPGLLAEANQGILYIDEVNLLPDHITDDILDAASSGWNVVEREGVSVQHPSRFILIGTMNPEEGALRPQILDRFGLHVKAENLADVEARLEVMRRNDEFNEDPLAFCEKYEPQQEALRRRIAAARLLLPKVRVSEEMLASIAKVCFNLKVDGYRPDIVIAKAARALASLESGTEVRLADVFAASELALSHRTRRSGLKSPASSEEIRHSLEIAFVRKGTPSFTKLLSEGLSFLRKLRKMRPGQALTNLALTLLTFVSLYFLVYFGFQALYTFLGRMPVSPLSYEGAATAILATVLLLAIMSRPQRKAVVRYLDFSKIITDTDTIGPVVIADEPDKPVRVSPSIEYGRKIGAVLQSGYRLFRGSGLQEPAPPPSSAKADSPLGDRVRRGRQYLVGKRAKVVTSAHRGRYVWYELPRERPWDLALGPTVRAAAPHQVHRESRGLAVAIKPQDFRAKMREYRTPFSIVLLVDMSLSMVNSMINLGRAIFSLHRSVYRRRDRVGLVVFKGSDAFVLQQPTTNLNLVVKKLMKVGASDFTPLAAGMLKAWKVLRLEKRRNRDAAPMLVIISDGITNIRLDRPLSAHTRKGFLSDAQADVMDMARLLVRDKIRTFVINTSHRRAETLKRKEEALKASLKWYTPTEFMMEVAKTTKGSYYGLASGGESSALVESTRLENIFDFESA